MNGFMCYIPTRFFFGAGCLEKLGEQKLPGKRALLVTSNGKSAKASGALGRTQALLEKAGASWALFPEIEANPLKETVMRGAAAAKSEGCDFVVALGGGSVMDACKAIAAMATNEGDLWDYVSGGTGKGKPLSSAPLPLVAITTTAGTGSEVDQWGVISKQDTNEKIGFGGDDRLFPVMSFVDPELMKTVPPKFTAYQGFDALFHSTETHIGKMANPMSDVYTRPAIAAIGKYLARAVKDGGDMEARAQVAFANTMSGCAMVVATTTSEHSLEHAMSAFHHDLPHGAGLIMISKAFYEHFVSLHVCDDRFIKMAKLLGNEKADKAEDFVTALVELQKACGVDGLKMSDYGITPDEFEKMAVNAKETMGGLFLNDPAPLSVEDCVKIYQKSYK